MKKWIALASALAISAAILLVALLPRPLGNCDICGAQHQPRNVAGGTSHGVDFFEVYAEHGQGWLQIFVENCRATTITPTYRLHFTARYDIAELYTALLAANSNEPFAATFDGEAITLTTEIPGLEVVQISLSERQPPSGFAYTMLRVR